MDLDRKTRDSIILAAAREIFDQPDIAFEHWRRDTARRSGSQPNTGGAQADSTDRRSGSRPNTGGAQADGFGPDIFDIIDQAVSVGWAAASDWLQSNGDKVQASLEKFTRTKVIDFFFSKRNVEGVAESMEAAPIIFWLPKIFFALVKRLLHRGVVSKSEPISSRLELSDEDLSKLAEKITERVLEHLAKGSDKP